MALPNIDWNKINQILGSKAAETVLGVAGSAMTAKSEADARDKQLAAQLDANRMNAAQNRAALFERQLEREQNNRIQRAGAVMSNSRLGENEAFATKNRIFRSLLPQMQPIRSMPTDSAIAAVMPKQNLIDFRITPEMLQGMSEDSIASAIGERAKMRANLDPSAPMPDLGPMGLDPTGEQGSLLEKYASMRQQQESDSDNRLQELINRALEDDAAGERRGEAPEGYEYDKKTGELKKKGGGFWKGLAKVGLAAAPFVAAPFTGGASLAAIGIGAGAASGAIDGGLKGALMGGAMGAIPGAAGAAGGGKAALASALKDPFTLARIASPALPKPIGSAINVASAVRGVLPRRPMDTRTAVIPGSRFTRRP